MCESDSPLFLAGARGTGQYKVRGTRIRQPVASNALLCLHSLTYLDISVNLIPEQCLIGIREACVNNQIELAGGQQVEQLPALPASMGVLSEPDNAARVSRMLELGGCFP